MVNGDDRGWKLKILIALTKALGPIGMVKFIQSFDLGKGDYTKERFQWLDQGMDEIINETEKKRTKDIE